MRTRSCTILWTKTRKLEQALRDIRQPLGALDSYAFTTRQTLRWNEFDRFGHLNNVAYYNLCDTALGAFHAGIGESLVHIEGYDTQNVTVDGRCVYFASIFEEDVVDIGVSVARVGTTSMTYQIGLFGHDKTTPKAQAQFTEVLIDKHTLKPRALTPAISAALNRFLRA